MRRITALTLSFALAAVLAVPASAASFGDVPDRHWASEAICRASGDGVIVGTGQTDPATGLPRFEPDADLTCAQFAVIVTGAFYRDIPEAAGPWYAPFQTAMEAAGWDEGAGIQDWEAPMTRYQMAAVLCNIADDQGVSLPDQESLAAAQGRIADWEQIPAEYRQAVAASFALELLSGVDETGTFAGDQTLTRAQAAVVYGKLKDALFASAGPMEQVLEEEERQLAEAGLTYEFTRYPGKSGTVYVAYQFGTSHGTACLMEYVTRDGVRLNILDLLPAYFFYGAVYYAQPAEIRFDEAGEKLTFITPIREGDAVTGEVKDWGDTLCTVDLTTGTVEAMEPMEPYDLTEWKIVWEPDNPLTPAPALNVEIKNESHPAADRPYIESGGFPFSGMRLTVNQNEVTISHYAYDCLFVPEFPDSGYGKAYSALEALSLPDVMTQDNFSAQNTPEQREEAGRYFQVLLNGTPVSGDLWWSQGNNHKDLNFTFDQPVELKYGDELTIWVGLPQA